MHDTAVFFSFLLVTMQFFLLLLPQQIPATRTHVGPLNTGMVGPEVPGLLMRYTD